MRRKAPLSIVLVRYAVANAPYKISDRTAATSAERLNVPKNRIYQIISEQRSITADTAIRLSIFFGTTAEFWLNLQNSYELDIFRQNSDNFKNIRPYEPPIEIANLIA